MATSQEDVLYQKASHYCSYQERTEKEVQEKLYTWGVTKKSVIACIIQALKADRFLDEERYVVAFIRSKFLGKQWGKIKIRTMLTKKGLDQSLIQKGFLMITDADYLQSLRHIAERKKQLLDGATQIQKQQKLIRYLLQKGYEPSLVHQVVQTTITQ